MNLVANNTPSACQAVCRVTARRTMTEPDDTTDRAARIATSIRESQANEQDGSQESRRKFLTKSALASGALLALGGGTGFAMASGQDDGSLTNDEMMAMFDDVEGTDIDVLNYALTLEHLEDAFYRIHIEQFSEDDFMQADALSNLSEEQRRHAWESVQVIGEHESTHVEVLTKAVSLLGGDPVGEASYEFGVESVGDFINLGAVLENTGVSAYAGAGPFIQSPDLLGSALAIHSVEARHAAVLNALNGESPYPDAFDAPASQSDVLEAAGQFITGSMTSTPGGNETDTSTGTSTGTPTETPTDSS